MIGVDANVILNSFTDRERDIDPEAVWTVALETGLSAYDAEYVALELPRAEEHLLAGRAL